MNLPAHLQGRQTKALNEVATLGIGSAMPPHISIRGNTFTLVDASGAQQNAGPVLDICVADVSDVVCKQFYSEKWTPDSSEPPLCWSANGIAPSREALTPQSPTCAACPKNARGSAVSAISGVAIKACRDERWLAVVHPQMPTMRFQLRLTPGSFKNWREYIEKCKGSNTDISNVVTRCTFQPQVNGVMLFQAINYIDEATANARDAGYAEKAFDVLVGRNDVPIQGALPAPAAVPTTLPPPGQPFLTSAPVNPQPIPQPQPAPFVPAPPAAFQPGPMGQPQVPQQSVAPSASPSEPPKRRRRTQAEIAAANGTVAAPAQLAPAFAQPAQAPIAPFRPQPVAEATNPAFAGGVQAAAPQAPSAPAQPAGAQFGIQPGVAPNPEIAATLNSLFAPK